MSELETKARGKINLALRVLGKRPDGYHEIWTVLDEIEFADTLAYEPADQGEPTLELVDETRQGEGVPDPLDYFPIPTGRDNLVLQAGTAFARRTGLSAGGTFRLTKRIPAGAGLGGGSSNAAAALRLLAERHGLDPTAPELLEIAAAIGSDVSFFLHGVRAWADSRGERIHPLRAGPRLHYVVVLPGNPCPTAAVYHRWHGKLTHQETTLSSEQLASGSGPSRRKPDLDAALPADAASKFVTDLLPAEPGAMAQGLFNDLEEAAHEVLPALGRLRDGLLGSGMPDLHLSGSGSSLFLAAGSSERAEGLARQLRQQLDKLRQTEDGEPGNRARVILTRSRL